MLQTHAGRAAGVLVFTAWAWFCRKTSFSLQDHQAPSWPGMAERQHDWEWEFGASQGGVVHSLLTAVTPNCQGGSLHPPDTTHLALRGTCAALMDGQYAVLRIAFP